MNRFWKQSPPALILTLRPDHAPNEIHNGGEMYVLRTDQVTSYRSTKCTTSSAVQTDTLLIDKTFTLLQVQLTYKALMHYCLWYHS